MCFIRCSGSQFDPEIVKQFLRMYEESPELFEDEEGREYARVTEVAWSHEDEKGTETELRSNAADGSLAGETASSVEPGLHPVQSHPVDFSRYEMDLNDYILSADSHFESFTGYSEQDIKSGRLRQRNLIPEEDRAIYFVEVVIVDMARTTMMKKE